MNNLSFSEQLSNINKQTDQVFLSSVWAQIGKDFSLAGLTGLSDDAPHNMEDFIYTLTAFIERAQNRFTNWDNINYRIDLPVGIEYNHYSREEYAQVIAYRCLQKVWLRQQLSGKTIEQ